MQINSIYNDMTESEKEVANYLTKLNLYWIYQAPVFVYDEKDRPRVWTPDFYIPKLGIYIEVCGSKNFNYDYRDNIYRKMEFLSFSSITSKKEANGKLT